jgi:hypothetical protein
MLLLLQKIYVGGKDYKEDQNLGGNFLMKKQRECEKFYNIEQRKLKRSNIIDSKSGYSINYRGIWPE